MKLLTLLFAVSTASIATSLSVFGQTITTQTLDSGARTGEYNSQAIINGHPAISYYDGTNRDLKYVRALDAAGTSWGAPMTLDTGGADDVGRYTSLASVDGKPAISYYDHTNGDLKFVRALDASGTSWGAPVIVHGGLHPAGMYCALAVVNGRPAISYFDSTFGDLKYVRALDASGTTWGTAVTIDSTGQVGEYNSLAVINGNPAISYYDWTNGNLKYVRATDANGTSWGTRLTLDGATTNVGYSTSLKVVNGNPAVSYHDVTNATLKYVRASNATGSTWGVPVVADGALNSGMQCSLLVVNGNPTISYRDATNRAIKYIRAGDPNGAAWPAPISVPGASGYPSVIVVGGNPAISYYSYPQTTLKWALIATALPDIAVSQGRALADGESTVAFGAAAIGASSAALVFTISNFGEADLTGLAVNIDGANAVDFAVGALSSATVSPGGTATFTVTFNPQAPGLRNAALHIASNVTGAKNPFDIGLTGKGETIPVATSTTATTQEDTASGPITLAGSDADGDSITYKVASLPTNGRLTHNGMWISEVPFVVTGTLAYAPGLNFNGTDAFTFRASDGDDDSAAATVGITVTPVNDPPAYTGRTVFNVYENTEKGTHIDTLTANDVEGDAVTWVIEPGVDEARFAIDAGSGAISVAGPLDFESQATHEVRVTISDDGTPVESRTVEVTVNLSNANERPDVVIAPGEVSILEDNATDPIAFSISDPDAEPDLSTLTVRATSDNPALVPDTNIVLADDQGSRTVVATPAANRSGTAIITLEVSDGRLTSTDSFAVVAGAVNDAPSFALPDSLTVATDSGGYRASNFASSILAGPPDESGQTVSFATNNDNNDLFDQQPALAADGTLAFTPGGTAGTATVTVVASDNAGMANGGVDTTAPQTFTIRVDAPAAIFNEFAVEAGLSGADAAPDAQPHADGVENVLKYAFNMDVSTADVRVLTPDGTAGLPQVELSTAPGNAASFRQATMNASSTQPVLRLTFLRRKGSGLIYTPQRTSSLTAAFVPMTSPETITDIDAQWERVSVEEPIPSTPGASAFVRLQVGLP